MQTDGRADFPFFVLTCCSDKSFVVTGALKNEDIVYFLDLSLRCDYKNSYAAYTVYMCRCVCR